MPTASWRQAVGVGVWVELVGLIFLKHFVVFFGGVGFLVSLFFLNIFFGGVLIFLGVCWFWAISVGFGVVGWLG